MNECKEKVYTRWSMKQEIIDDLESYDLDDVSDNDLDDIMREIADSLVPAYNHVLIEQCSHYQGEEFWDLWNDSNGFGGTTPLDMLRENLWSLYYDIGCEVLEERKEEE
jgi:hypothetical protein